MARNTADGNVGTAAIATTGRTEASHDTVHSQPEALVTDDLNIEHERGVRRESVTEQFRPPLPRRQTEREAHELNN